MKKEKRKIQVLRKATESDIKLYGSNKWLSQHWRWWALIFVATLAWIVAGEKYLIDGWLPALIKISPLVIAYIIWGVFYYGAGRKYWNEIKDKPEPIELD